jgi:TPR repeat protein
MKHSRTFLLLAAALFAGVGAATAAPSTASSPAPASGTTPRDPSNADILKAMDAVDTWGHPDLFGEFAGMKRYAKGHYKAAMPYLLNAARFADKPSQLAIGLMYVNGLGVAKSLPTGCAWLKLAAERGYSRFVATYDANCAQLAPTQHQQMESELAKLLPEFGDKVAKQRMATQLRLAYTSRTGSHVGFDADAEVHGGADMAFGASVVAGSAPRNCGKEIVYAGGLALPTKGCTGSGYWSRDYWDPDTYFHERDAQWRGTVTVGSLQDMSKPAAKPPAQPSGSAPPASGTDH